MENMHFESPTFISSSKHIYHSRGDQKIMINLFKIIVVFCIKMISFVCLGAFRWQNISVDEYWLMRNTNILTWHQLSILLIIFNFQKHSKHSSKQQLKHQTKIKIKFIISSSCKQYQFLNNLDGKVSCYSVMGQYQMFKHPFAHQQKQKLLNYEIKVIQECQDTLFNQTDCQHQRYLPWQLDRTLQQLLSNYHYQVKWIGNDSLSYLQAYFYVVVVGCSAHPNTMVALKSVIYMLAEKYLAQFQQKLLIQDILVKLFQQIEERQSRCFKEFPQQKTVSQVFSKMTTCITSPCKSKQAQQLSKQLRNSDYYKSTLRQGVPNSRESNQRQSQTIHKHIRWYQIYNKIFNFMQMVLINDDNIKLIIDAEMQKGREQFIVSVQKGCFFVVELLGKQQRRRELMEEKSCSIIEESKEYLNQLIEKQRKKSGKQDSFGFQGVIGQTQFTPKFISNRKKLSLVDHDFYNEEIHNKNVQIQVLDVNQFEDSQTKNIKSNGAVNHQNSQINKILIFKNKIDNIHNIKNTVKSINEKRAIRQQIRSHPLFQQFKQGIPLGQRQLKTEQSVANQLNMDFDQQRLKSYKTDAKINALESVKQQYRKIGLQMPKQTRSHSATKILKYSKSNKTSLMHKNYQQKWQDHSQQTIPTNPELSKPKISTPPPNQVSLSANNIKKRYNKMGIMKNGRNVVSPKQFHSLSPGNKLVQRPATSYQYFSPGRLPINSKISLERGGKFKFIYR